jgi:hypothetical protein
MAKLWMRASDMAGCSFDTRGSVLVGGAETEVGHGIRVTADQVPRLAHGPARDVVEAGAVVERVTCRALM